MDEAVQTLEFQAEARQLLHLMVHSIYSDKDVFLRELVSNASDALDRLRLESMRDKDLDVDTSDLHVDLAVDPAARTLTVRDNGIGMSREEVVDLIGTIARSGTAELVRALREARDPAASQELIGQFGVGFYSAFMVADRVSLVTRRAGAHTGTRWESTGEGTYTVAEVPDAPQGTAVTLHLKPEDAEDALHDYTAEPTLRRIVKRYSDFIAWPIRMSVERPGEDGATTREEQTLNSRRALWTRPREEITEAEYHEFYKHVSHDWSDPLLTVHTRGEGSVEYEALLFVPSHAPLDLYQRGGRRGVQLYVRRVFIMDDCDALMPDYLRFVKGVVDAHDLSLNISREILQQDRQIRVVRRRLVKRVLGSIRDLMTAQPERYATLWAEFGPALKEGLLEDADNRDVLLDVVSLATTHDPDAPTTLRGYVERMKEGQDAIWYLTGESRTLVEQSPHLEALRGRGYEVLLLTDPVDELWVERVGEFDGHPLRSAAQGEVDLDEQAGPEEEARRRDFGPLLAWLSGELAEDVREVRLSTRLTSSPACLVGEAHDMTPMLEKLYRAMGQQVPTVKRVLELNPGHPLVAGLRRAYEADAADAALGQTAHLLYGMALLAEGGDLRDPAGFSRLLADRLARTLPTG